MQVRWSDSVQKFREQGKMLPGDVLLVASFISYLGCFTKQYRLELFERKWLPFMKKLPKQIPLSLGCDELIIDLHIAAILYF